MSVDGSDDAHQTLLSQHLDQENQNLHHTVFGGFFDLLISLDYGLNASAQESPGTETRTTEVSHSAPVKAETPASEELSSKIESTHFVEEKEPLGQTCNSLRISQCGENIKDSASPLLDDIKPTKKKITEILNHSNVQESSTQLSDDKKPTKKEVTEILNNSTTGESLTNNLSQLVNKVDLTKEELTLNPISEDTLQNDHTQLAYSGEPTNSTSIKQTLQNDSTQCWDSEKPTKEELGKTFEHLGEVKNECDKDLLLPKIEDEPETIIPDDLKHIPESLQSLQTQNDDWPFSGGPKNVIVLDILDPSRHYFKINKSDDIDIKSNDLQSVLQGSSEGESILGVYGEPDKDHKTQMASELSFKTAISSLKKVSESDLDLDMGCYSDASEEEDVKDASPLSSPAPDLNSNPTSREQEEQRNDTDSGCDLQTDSPCGQGLPKDDSRVLQVSLRRLEEEEWFDSSKMDDSNSTHSIDCRLESGNEKIKFANLNYQKIKKLKKKKYKRQWAKKTKLYRCLTCKKMFLHKVLLDKHNNDMKCLRMWKCNQCGGQFKSKERLQEHSLSKCDSVKVFECDSCDKRYIFKKHLLEHITPVCKSSIKKNCEICGLVFKNNVNLNKHKKIHDKTGFLCEICGKVVITAYKSTFESHLLTHTPEGTFTCAECNKSFESLDILKKHLPVHGMFVFSDDFSYHCSFCGKPFVKRECLKEHMATHTGEMPFDCSSCGKKFGKRRNLKSHLKICRKVKLEVSYNAEELDIKPEICEKCFRAFDNPEGYRDHLCIGDLFNFQSGTIKIENDVDPPPIFEDEKPYVCETCGSAIEGLENIINHVETCGKSSVSKTEYGIKPSSKSKLPHLSSICGKSFTTNWSMRRHSKSCLFCIGGKKAVEDTNPSVCQECGRAFSSSQNLKMHLTFCKVKTNAGKSKTITVKKENLQQVCHKCGSQFSSYGNWKRHFKFCYLKPTSDKDSARQKMCFGCGKMFNCRYIYIHRKTCAKAIKIKLEPNFEDRGNAQSNSSSPQELSGQNCPKCGKFVKYSTNMYRHKKNCQGNLIQTPETLMDIKDESTLSSFETIDCPERVETHDENVDGLVELFDSRCSMSTNSFDNSLNSHDNDAKALLCEESSVLKTSYVPYETKSLGWVEDLDLSITESNSELKALKEERQLNDPVKMEPLEDLEKHEEQNLLMCKTCGKCFQLERYLIKHLLLCKVKKYICNVCNFKFKSQENLKRHMVVHSKKNIEVTCSKCGKTLAHQRSLRRHYKNCKGLPPVSTNNVQNYNKPSIKQELSNTDELNTKLENYPTETLVPEMCNICNRKLSSVFGLRRHMKTVHKHVYSTSSTNQPSSEESNSTDQNNEPITNERTYVEAPKSSLAKSYILKAVLVHKLEERAHMKKEDGSETKKNIPVEIPQPQICSDCGKIFYSNLNYKNHLEGNTCKLTLTCILCKHLATNAEEFTSHMLNHGIHVQDKSFSCKTCGMPLEKRKRSVDCHMLLHTGEKPFKCDTCSKSFTRKDGLTRHSMVHTGVLPFSCYVCKCSFMERRSLKRHLHNVHKILEDQLSSSSPQSSSSLSKSFETNTEIGESHLKTFFEEKPDIKDLLERNLEELENFEQEKLFTVQHEGKLVFYGSLNQSADPAVQNDTESDKCQSELLSAIDSISDLGYQQVESELTLEQW